MVKESRVADFYVREYARLECERALAKSLHPSEDEALKRLNSRQKKLQRRENRRFIAERAGAPATNRKAMALHLDTLRRKGSEISRRFFSSVRDWFAALRSPEAAMERKDCDDARGK